MQRHDAGVLSVLPPSSGGAADRLNPVGVCDVCGCVPEALCAEVASGTNLYLDLKNGERDLVAEGEKGKNCHRLVAVERRQATTECIQRGMFGLASTNKTI